MAIYIPESIRVFETTVQRDDEDEKKDEEEIAIEQAVAKREADRRRLRNAQFFADYYDKGQEKARKDAAKVQAAWAKQQRDKERDKRAEKAAEKAAFKRKVERADRKNRGLWAEFAGAAGDVTGWNAFKDSEQQIARKSEAAETRSWLRKADLGIGSGTDFLLDNPNASAQDTLRNLVKGDQTDEEFARERQQTYQDWVSYIDENATDAGIAGKKNPTGFLYWLGGAASQGIYRAGGKTLFGVDPGATDASVESDLGGWDVAELALAPIGGSSAGRATVREGVEYGAKEGVPLLSRVFRTGTKETFEEGGDRFARETTQEGGERTFRWFAKDDSKFRWGRETAENTFDRTAREATEETFDRTAREATEETFDRTARETAEQSGDSFFRETLEQTGKETVETATKETFWTPTKTIFAGGTAGAIGAASTYSLLSGDGNNLFSTDTTTTTEPDPTTDPDATTTDPSPFGEAENIGTLTGGWALLQASRLDGSETRYFVVSFGETVSKFLDSTGTEKEQSNDTPTESLPFFRTEQDARDAHALWMKKNNIDEGGDGGKNGGWTKWQSYTVIHPWHILIRTSGDRAQYMASSQNEEGVNVYLARNGGVSYNAVVFESVDDLEAALSAYFTKAENGEIDEKDKPTGGAPDMSIVERDTQSYATSSDSSNIIERLTDNKVALAALGVGAVVVWKSQEAQ